MSNIRTPEEVRDFINAHCFATRYHAFCIRALIHSKYGRIKEFREMTALKYPYKKGESMGLPVLTVDDAIKYLTEKIK